MSKFQREERYIVVKLKHLAGLQQAPLRNFLRENRVPQIECVVVEHDWPEYHLVWAMIEHRMAGKPVPDFALWRRANELQERLNAADQRNDDLGASLKDLISAVRSINRSPAYKVTVIGDDEPQYRQRKEWIDWVLELCDKASAGLEQPATAFGFPVVVDPTLAPNEMRLVQPAPHRPEDAPIKGMIAAHSGEFAIMIDEANAHYGWTFKKHPDGMWVSGRKATDAEMQAARQYARQTNQH
ncbi:MAG: hypothetical protein K0S85_4879 [Pseudomonas orientalis]|nr:hypothetical protein [Pseudomonas orientalis]